MRSGQASSFYNIGDEKTISYNKISNSGISQGSRSCVVKLVDFNKHTSTDSAHQNNIQVFTNSPVTSHVTNSPYWSSDSSGSSMFRDHCVAHAQDIFPDIYPYMQKVSVKSIGYKTSTYSEDYIFPPSKTSIGYTAFPNNYEDARYAYFTNESSRQLTDTYGVSTGVWITRSSGSDSDSNHHMAVVNANGAFTTVTQGAEYAAPMIFCIG